MNAMKGNFLDAGGEFTIRGEPDQQMAIDILHGKQYHQAKVSIMEPINQFYQLLDNRTQEQVDEATRRLYSSLYLLIFIFILTIVSVALLILAVKNYQNDVTQSLKEYSNRILKRTEKLDRTNKELQKAFDEIYILRGIIPICSYCHNIRDDKGAWERIENYISKHSDAEFSHGICPDCYDKVRAERGLGKKVKLDK